MNTWEAKGYLFSELCVGVTIRLDLKPAQARKHSKRPKWLLQGLECGYYEGGDSRWAQMYDAITEAAGVPSMRNGGWCLYYHRLSRHLRRALFDMQLADGTALALEGKHNSAITDRAYFMRSYYCRMHYKVLTTKSMKAFALRYASRPEYQKKIAPWVEKVKKGKLRLVSGRDGNWTVK